MLIKRWHTAGSWRTRLKVLDFTYIRIRHWRHLSLFSPSLSFLSRIARSTHTRASVVHTCIEQCVVAIIICFSSLTYNNTKQVRAATLLSIYAWFWGNAAACCADVTHRCKAYSCVCVYLASLFFLLPPFFCHASSLHLSRAYYATIVDPALIAKSAHRKWIM